jgi:hypothetical protein
VPRKPLSAEELNKLLYFARRARDNGQIAPETLDRIESDVRTHKKGGRDRHSRWLVMFARIAERQGVQRTTALRKLAEATSIDAIRERNKAKGIPDAPIENNPLLVRNDPKNAADVQVRNLKKYSGWTDAELLSGLLPDGVDPSKFYITFEPLPDSD